MSRSVRPSLSPYQSFLERPSRETYRAAARALAQGSGRPARATSLEELARLVQAENWSAALQCGQSLVPLWLLSPQFHYLLAQVARAQGHAADEELEVFQFRTCLASLLATGKGDAASPFQLLYPSDAADILAFLRRTARAQLLIRRTRKLLEVVTCTDGSEVWCDASRLLVRPVPALETAAAL